MEPRSRYRLKKVKGRHLPSTFCGRAKPETPRISNPLPVGLPRIILSGPRRDEESPTRLKFDFVQKRAQRFDQPARIVALHRVRRVLDPRPPPVGQRARETCRALVG